MCRPRGGRCWGLGGVCLLGGGVSEQAGLEQAGRDAVCRPRGGGVLWCGSTQVEGADPPAQVLKLYAVG